MIRLTRSQVRDIDRRAMEEYQIPGIILMENAARAAAEVAIEMLAINPGNVLLLCGGGNNGGDGLAVARHLHNRGVDLSIALTVDPAKYTGDALINWRIVQAMKLQTKPLDIAELASSRPALIIDAIFGTGLTQAPRPPFAEIAAAVAASQSAVLAVDIPSGLDCDSGIPFGPCIRADRTITFVAEKIGFANPAAADYLGRVTVGDIGCPRELISE
jgi:NAD(P)H-hydrate epimerase